MKSRNKKRLLALVLCMVVAISNSSFIFASETGQAEYPQEAEVQTQDEAVADDMDVAAYAADEGQAVADGFLNVVLCKKKPYHLSQDDMASFISLHIFCGSFLFIEIIIF